MNIEPGMLCMLVNMPEPVLGPANGSIVTAVRYVGKHVERFCGGTITVHDAWEVDSPRDGEGWVERRYLLPITGPRAALDVQIENQMPEAA